MSLATLDGATVPRACVQVPAWGAWWADVDLAEPVEFAGSVTLAIAGITGTGTVVSGGVANGRAAYHIVGGRGGWGRDVPAKGYSDDAGVKIATVANDAAAAVGETLADVPTARMSGPHFARVAGPASRVLHDLALRAWYVGLDGVTRFGSRASTTYEGDATRTRVDPQGAVIELATDTLVGLEPGVIVDGAAPATDVEYVLDAKRLTARVYSGPRRTRRLDAMARIIDALLPRARYAGVWEFRVVTQSGHRYNLQPVRAASGLPDLANVPCRGVAGVRHTVTPGSLVLVAFADSDPSRPAIIAQDAHDAPGWMPLALEFGDGLTLGVARLTDTVQAGAFAGVITGASARIKAGL